MTSVTRYQDYEVGIVLILYSKKVGKEERKRILCDFLSKKTDTVYRQHLDQ